MTLTGKFSELPLTDLIQVLSANRKTCRVYIRVDEADGELFIDAGQIVHAQFGQLFGSEAVYAFIAASARARFTLQSGARTDKRTVYEATPTLVMEGLRRIDEGLVSHLTGPISAPAAQRASGRWTVLTATSIAVAIVAVGMVIGAAWSPEIVALRTAPAAIDALELTGPNDRKPQLKEGTHPVSPKKGSALSPSIVCRILVSADGTVARASVYRSRPGLGPFESVALAAVEQYVFEPARRDGAPIPVWVNWPVTFADAPRQTETRLRVKGSDTIGGALGPALVAAFAAKHPDTSIEIEALGSGTGFVGLFDGSADVAASSRAVKPEELDQAERLGVRLEELVLGYDGIAVVVHRDNPITSLTLDELGWLFSGKIDTWAKVGGAQAPVRPVSRPSYSGTHSFFRDRVLRADGRRAAFARNVEVLETNEEVVEFVASHPNAITFVGLAWAKREGVKVLAVVGSDGPVEPTTASIRSGRYPISRPLLFYTRGRPKGPLAAFLRFALSPDGQSLVSRNGFVASEASVDSLIDPKLVDEPMTSFDALKIVRVFFGQGQTKVDSRVTPQLERIVTAIRSGAYRARIVGHSDASGRRANNARVSKKRAESVRDALIARGVDKKYLEVEAASASKPLESNRTRGGRRENRRVDVTLYPRQ